MLKKLPAKLYFEQNFGKTSKYLHVPLENYRLYDASRTGVVF